MHLAEEGHQVVLAHGEDVNVSNDHQIVGIYRKYRSIQDIYTVAALL